MSNDTVYQIVTDKIVAMLEKGIVPWRMPWTRGMRPQNVWGRGPYRGVNAFMTMWEQYEKGYSTPFWATFSQVKKNGGRVRKGEGSTLIVFWKRVMVRELQLDGSYKPKEVPLLRYSRVWNLDQIDGLKLPRKVSEAIERMNQGQDNERFQDAESIVAGYANGPTILEGGTQAVYNWATDAITVPKLERFDGSEEYYATLFHELCHSTGHKSRLNRKIENAVGSHDYGREELTAEMGSAFLCAEAGIANTLQNSANYIGGWLKAIKEDVRAVVVAAGAGQKAADHILGRVWEDTGENDSEDASEPAQQAPAGPSSRDVWREETLALYHAAKGAWEDAREQATSLYPTEMREWEESNPKPTYKQFLVGLKKERQAA